MLGCHELSETYAVHNSSGHKEDLVHKPRNSMAVLMNPVMLWSLSGDHASHLAKWQPVTTSRIKNGSFPHRHGRHNTGQTLGTRVSLLRSIWSLAGEIHSLVRPRSGVELSSRHRGGSHKQTWTGFPWEEDDRMLDQQKWITISSDDQLFYKTEDLFTRILGA